MEHELKRQKVLVEANTTLQQKMRADKNREIATLKLMLIVSRGVHGNGEDWDPMGPMGFPWEWE